ncbi:hypothetical protein KI387_039206, partial [Taxus chinensis]
AAAEKYQKFKDRDMATFVAGDPHRMVERFDGVGFNLWKLRMKMLLLNKDLLNIVEGTEIKPTQDADLISKWESKEGRARSCILLSLSDNVLLHLKMQETQKISDFTNQFKSLKNQLAACGSVIAEEDVVMSLLGSFPESYSGLVVALSTQSNLDLTKVIAALLQEEIRRKDGGLNDENPTTLFSAGYKGKAKRKSDNKSHPSQSNVSKNDSGATQHMTPERSWFMAYTEAPKSKTVNLGDDSKCEMIGIGDIPLQMPDGGYKKIQNVWYVPALVKSLLSVSKITDASIIAQFDSKECVLKDVEGVIVATGIRDGNLYKLCAAVPDVVLTTTNNEISDSVLWHHRFGHANPHSLRMLKSEQLVEDFNLHLPVELGVCE